MIVVLALGGTTAWVLSRSRTRIPQVRPAPLLDQTAAMRLVYRQFDPMHGGVLHPLHLNATWDIKAAEKLSSPHLFAIYTESGRRKAVLVVKTQELEDGQPAMGHALGAELSFHVFVEARGAWTLAQQNPGLVKAGSYGDAPDGRLVKLGPEKSGVLFELGYTSMGTTSSGILIVSLSEPKAIEVLSAATGEQNDGTCSDDPAERERSGLLQPCYAWDSTLAFRPRKGDPYYVLEQATHGTDLDLDTWKVVPRSAVKHYVFTPKGYMEATVDPATLGPAIPIPAH